LWGDSSKAKEVLGWEAEVKMEDLALMMYENDYEQQKNSLEYIQKLQQEN
jgi:GDP-D-mannose dehydratase